MLLLVVLIVFFGSLFQLLGLGLAGILTGGIEPLLESLSSGAFADLSFDERKALRAIQFFSTTGLFFAGPAVYAYLTLPDWSRSLGLDRRLSLKAMLIALVAMLLLSPAIEQLVNFSQFATQAMFSDSVNIQLREMMEASERTVTGLIRATHWTERLETLIVVACLPALAEEWLFRGVLQTELLKTRLQPLFALAISALVFAVFHLQPFHLLPLFVFGFLLGWIRWISGNLWYSIGLHFANNALVLFAMWYPERLGDTAELYLGYALAMAAGSLVLLCWFKRLFASA